MLIFNGLDKKSESPPVNITLKLIMSLLNLDNLFNLLFISFLSCSDAFKCLDITRADGVMIGRSAYKHPLRWSGIDQKVYGINTNKTKIIANMMFSNNNMFSMEVNYMFF